MAKKQQKKKQQKKKRNGKGEGLVTEPRPSYGALQGELKRLETVLKHIRAQGKDSSGPLSAVQLTQVDAAIKDIGTAHTLMGCIQDQSPYSFGQMKK